MPLTQQQMRGQVAGMPVRQYALEAGAVLDPYAWNGRTLQLSGLSVLPFGAGQYPPAVFTATNLETWYGIDDPIRNVTVNLGGAILDGNGVVVTFYSPRQVVIQGQLKQGTGTLGHGESIEISLDPIDAIPAALAGEQVTIVVGDSEAFASATTGNAFALPSSGVLTKSMTVAASPTSTGGTSGGSGPPGATGSGTPTPSKAVAWLTSTGGLLLTGAVVVVGGVGLYRLVAGVRGASRPHIFVLPQSHSRYQSPYREPRRPDDVEAAAQDLGSAEG